MNNSCAIAISIAAVVIIDTQAVLPQPLSCYLKGRDTLCNFWLHAANVARGLSFECNMLHAKSF